MPEKGVYFCHSRVEHALFPAPPFCVNQKNTEKVKCVFVLIFNCFIFCTYFVSSGSLLWIINIFLID